MIETAYTNVGIIASGLLTAYWTCLVVGGGLLLISTVLGSHGADTDVDADFGADLDADLSLDAEVSVDADVGVDIDAAPDANVETAHADAIAHGGALSLASWFSIHFVVYFTAVFGMVGVTLTHLTATSPAIVAVASVLGGLVIGQGVHQLMRYLRRTSGNSVVSASDYENRPARVTIAMAQGRKGEVAVRVGRGARYVPAVAKHKEEAFAAGDKVAVVAYQAGVAEVISRKEFEFMGEHQQGEFS